MVGESLGVGQFHAAVGVDQGVALVDLEGVAAAGGRRGEGAHQGSAADFGGDGMDVDAVDHFGDEIRLLGGRGAGLLQGIAVQDPQGGVVKKRSRAASGIQNADAGGGVVAAEVAPRRLLQPGVIDDAVGQHRRQPVGGVILAESLALGLGDQILVDIAEDIAGAGAPVVGIGGMKYLPGP